MRRTPIRLILALFVAVLAVAALTSFRSTDSSAPPPPAPEILPPVVPVNYAVTDAAVAQYQHDEVMSAINDFVTWLQAEADRKAAEAKAAAAKKQAAAARQQQASSGPVDTSGMSAFFQCVIRRESGGNPNALNSSSGAGGLYQFLPSTARTVAGWMGRDDLYSTPPHLWPVADQHAGAQLLYERMGRSPWYYPASPC